MAYDPADPADRPPGALYAGTPNNEPGRGTGEPGQSSLGYVFTLPKGPAKTLTVSKSGPPGTVTSEPEGIDCGSECTVEFEEDETVTLTASPEAGSTFSGWSGECESTSGSKCEVKMSAARAVTASFETGTASKFPLTVAKGGSGAGTVTSEPAGISCGIFCSAEYSSDTEVTLTVTPQAGSAFAGWATKAGSPGTCTGTASPCKVTIAAAVELEATFNLTAKPKFKLTVSKSGTGSGTVTSTPSGINCGSGAGCEAEFEEGVEVTLNQAASPGSEFKEWSGACTGSGTCKVTMSAAKSLGAVFSPIPRTLSITKAGTGSGEVKCKLNGGSAGPCTSPVPNGTAVEVIATAGAGSAFAGFSAGTGSAGGCSTTPCSFTIEANSTLTATFNLTAKPKFKLTVSKSGTGSGTVTSTPSGINCGTGAACEHEYEEGIEVDLHQSAEPGSEFKEWRGACSGSGTCKVTLTAAKSVTAKFEPTPKPKFKLSVSKSGGGSGTITSSPAGIDCGSDLRTRIRRRRRRHAQPLSQLRIGIHRMADAPCDESTATTCKVDERLQAKSVSGRFVVKPKPKFKLSVTKTGGGPGTIAATRPLTSTAAPTANTNTTRAPSST